MSHVTFAVLSARTAREAPGIKITYHTTIYGEYDEGETRFQIYVDLLTKARANAMVTGNDEDDIVTNFFYCEPNVVSGRSHE